MLKSILAILVVLLPILMVIAFVTIAERKIMGSMQRRCGPNAVGFEKKNKFYISNAPTSIGRGGAAALKKIYWPPIH